MQKNRRIRSSRWLIRGLSLWLVIACLCVSVSAAGLEAERIDAAVSEMGRGIDRLTVDAVPPELMEALTDSGERTLEQVEPAQADALDCVTVRNTDGSLSRLAFQQPVKYIDEQTNEIKFIDNTIKQPDSLLARAFSEVAYENTSNSIRVSMPKKLGQGIRVEHGSNSLKMTPAAGQEKGAVKKDVERMDSAETVVEYAGAFGEHTSMRYQPVSQGVKEYIVLEQYTGVREFQFWLDAPGLTPEVTEENDIRFLDANGDSTFVIARAWVTDSYTEQAQEGEENAPESRHFDDNIQYRLQQSEDGRYLLTMTVSEEFLSSPDTVYPASIQSVALYGYSEGGMSYTTVFSSTSTTWPSHTYEYIQTGYRSGYGESIGYVQFDNMDNFIDIHPSLISRATVLAKQTYGNSSSYIIGAYDSNTSVASASATYSALNSSIGTQQDTTLCEGNAVYGWWITNIFKAWLGYELSGKGWNTYQFMLKATSTGKSYKQFYCSNSNLYFRVDFTQDNYGCAWAFNSRNNGYQTSSPFINCYLYALGISTPPHPGTQDDGLKFNRGDDIDTMVSRVKNDVSSKGRSIREIDGPAASINNNEYRFCMRVYYYDYHFWVQTDTGEWADKQGWYNAAKLRGYIDPTTADWGNYTGKTVYFAATL